MKYEIKISRLAVVWALCASTMSGAFAASSVRALGGAGTYSGSASASAATTSGNAINAARAGSLRVAPSAGGTSMATPSGTTTNGRVATTPRLSIGKYLGGGSSVSNANPIKNQKPSSSSSSGGSSANPGLMADLDSRLTEVEKRVENNIYEKGDIDAKLGDKQNVLTPVDDYIVIEDDEIFLDVDALQGQMQLAAGQDGQDGRKIVIGSNDTHLLWQYEGDTEWQELIALATIVNSASDQMNTAITNAIANANIVTQSAMETYVTDAVTEATTNMATTTYVDNKVSEVVSGDIANALTGPSTGEYVLAVSNGQKAWLEVVSDVSSVPPVTE